MSRLLRRPENGEEMEGETRRRDWQSRAGLVLGLLSAESGFAIALALLCVATILVTLATELPSN